jgi:hypothetical protein
MFSGCNKLNDESLQRIANYINDLRLVTSVDKYDEDLGYISLPSSVNFSNEIKT